MNDQGNSDIKQKITLELFHQILKLLKNLSSFQKLSFLKKKWFKTEKANHAKKGSRNQAITQF
jgi:hypothetical protein